MIMSNTAGVLQEKKRTACQLRSPESVLHIVLSFCVVMLDLLVFILCLVSNVYCVSRLSILDCAFGFL